MAAERKSATSLAEDVRLSWLFWMTLCLGFFLAIYVPLKCWLVVSEQANMGDLDFSSLAVSLFGLLSAFVGLRWCLLFTLSYSAIASHKRQLAPMRDAFMPYVSILVPAYSEASSIQDALTALVRLDYPAYEIIFVDDGSRDDTYRLALPSAQAHCSQHGVCHVRVFTKPNGGKWSAHNFALRHARGTLILCLDADSRIEAGALRLMVRHMKDKSVGAVSGQIRVRNRDSLLGVLQAFEYVLANGALRLSQGATGTVMIVPGPIGLFRREAMERVRMECLGEDDLKEAHTPGPFSPLTFAEDFHLSLSMLSLGYRVVYEPHAIAHTKAPGSLPGLISQRYRWNRGTMQVISWYLRRTLRGAKSPLRLKAWVATAFLLDYYCFPALYFVLLASLLMYFLKGGSLSTLAWWAAAGWLVNVMSGSLYAVSHRDRVLLCLVSPLFDLYQGVLLNCAWVIAIFDQARGASMRW